MISKTVMVFALLGICVIALGFFLHFYVSNAWEEYKRTAEYLERFGGAELDPKHPLSQETLDWIETMKNEIVYPYRSASLLVIVAGLLLVVNVVASYLIVREFKS